VFLWPCDRIEKCVVVSGCFWRHRHCHRDYYCCVITQYKNSVLCIIVAKEENEERMMIDPTSREDPKVKELLQV